MRNVFNVDSDITSKAISKVETVKVKVEPHSFETSSNTGELSASSFGHFTVAKTSGNL
jgi:hypothetical protein